MLVVDDEPHVDRARGAGPVVGVHGVDVTPDALALLEHGDLVAAPEEVRGDEARHAAADDGDAHAR